MDCQDECPMPAKTLNEKFRTFSVCVAKFAGTPIAFHHFPIRDRRLGHPRPRSFTTPIPGNSSSIPAPPSLLSYGLPHPKHAEPRCQSHPS